MLPSLPGPGSPAFAKLAKENSGDPSSAGKGGDMDFVDRGITVEAFDTAAFSIPLNTISDPIRTKEFGYHIIKVLARKPAGYRPFEEVRPMLSAQLADQQAKDQARDEITRISARLKQTKPKTAAEFAALANDKVSSNDTQWFSKADQIPGIGNNPPLSGWAFSAKQGDVGEILGTQRGPAIAYLYAGLQAGATSDEVLAAADADGAPFTGVDAYRAFVTQGLDRVPAEEALLCPRRVPVERAGGDQGRPESPSSGVAPSVLWLYAVHRFSTEVYAGPLRWPVARPVKNAAATGTSGRRYQSCQLAPRPARIRNRTIAINHQ